MALIPQYIRSTAEYIIHHQHVAHFPGQLVKMHQYAWHLWGFCSWNPHGCGKLWKMKSAVVPVFWSLGRCELSPHSLQCLPEDSIAGMPHIPFLRHKMPAGAFWQIFWDMEKSCATSSEGLPTQVQNLHWIKSMGSKPADEERLL